MLKSDVLSQISDNYLAKGTPGGTEDFVDILEMVIDLVLLREDARTKRTVIGYLWGHRTVRTYPIFSLKSKRTFVSL